MPLVNLQVAGSGTIDGGENVQTQPLTPKIPMTTAVNGEAVIDLVDSSPIPGGGERRSRPILLHASGFRQSPYADVKPADHAPSKLWHRSPGTPGW